MESKCFILVPFIWKCWKYNVNICCFFSNWGK